MIIKPLTLLIIGRSGCGKGTQAELLIKHFKIDIFIQTGDLFRKWAQQPTVTGKKIAEILSEGGLLEDWVAVYNWQRELFDNLKSEEQSIIFDGLARRLDEAKVLDEVMQWLERPLTPILIDITREEAFKRLQLRGRSDDTDENINKRLDWYDDEVMQSVNYYEEQGKLLKIDGMPTEKEVSENILSALSKISSNE